MAEKANCMNLRLLMDKKTRRILYAEAGKDFVDLLFSFLLLPTGEVVRLLAPNKCLDKVCCLANLYNSVDKLQPQYMSGDKSELLRPKVTQSTSINWLPIQAPSKSTDPVTVKYYFCGNMNVNNPTFGTLGFAHNHMEASHNITNQRGHPCKCGKPMEREVQLRNPVETVSVTEISGYVKEAVTFIITDDLTISPTSTITSITLLNKSNVSDLADLEERNVTVGSNQVLDLLAAAMISNTALNDVFFLESSSTEA